MLLTGNGSPAGEQVVEPGDDGRTRVRYIFKDNGRGPELEESIRLAPDGTLAEYEVKGQAEMGGPVAERFTRSGNKAQWRSLAEAGSKELSGTAFYVLVNVRWNLRRSASPRRPRARTACWRNDRTRPRRSC